VYEELRAAIARGLHVENLWVIVRLCSKLLQSDQLANPVIALAVKAICTELASYQDGQAVSVDRADLVDAHLHPAIERLLDVAYGTGDEILAALNGLAKAYAETIPRS
jgi:hypothetical protein